MPDFTNYPRADDFMLKYALAFRHHTAGPVVMDPTTPDCWHSLQSAVEHAEYENEKVGPVALCYDPANLALAPRHLICDITKWPEWQAWLRAARREFNYMDNNPDQIRFRHGFIEGRGLARKAAVDAGWAVMEATWKKMFVAEGRRVPA